KVIRADDVPVHDDADLALQLCAFIEGAAEPNVDLAASDGAFFCRHAELGYRRIERLADQTGHFLFNDSTGTCRKKKAHAGNRDESIHGPLVYLAIGGFHGIRKLSVLAWACGCCRNLFWINVLLRSPRLVDVPAVELSR